MPNQYTKLAFTTMENGKRKPEYEVWRSIKKRCLLKTHPAFKNYGGRGITICDRWKDSFENFITDMGRRPSSNHQIERIDNNGNYEPPNCKWATVVEQINNRRNTVIIEHNGISKPLSYWAKEVNINVERLRVRLKEGWPFDRAISEPLKKINRYI